MSNKSTQIKTLGTGWLSTQLSQLKPTALIGYILIAFLGIGLAYCTSEINYKAGMLICGLVAGIFLVLICLLKIEWGFYIVILISTFIGIPSRLFLIDFPVGLIIEAFTYAVFFAIVAKQYRERKNVSGLWSNPISLIFFIQLAYYVIQAFNPENQGVFAWSLFFRKQISYLAFYYMAFMILDSYQKIIFFIKVWLVLSLIIALYGIKQQWFGLFEFETNWIYMDPQRAALLFQNGFIKKFSILSDPAAFGVGMASMAVFCFLLGLRSNKRTRIKLMLAGFIMLLASSYSGTRTSNLMVVAGVAAYAIFTLNEKRTFVFVGTFLLMGVFILYGPFQNNPVVFRIKTTFEGKKDASASLRDVNRHYVQPYVYKHPLGGGINTSGLEGLNYTPSHYLAGFSPDGGYMKVLVEQGWIGLIIHIIYYFIILKVGIDGFFKAKTPKIKNLYIAFTIYFFILYVGEASQNTYGGYPYSLFYFPGLVILYKLIDFDSEEKQILINKKKL